MRSIWATACVLSVCALYVLPVSAELNTYQGIDPGAGSSSPRPNTAAAATAFQAAAGNLGPAQLITFESLPLGNFTSLTIAPGVVASQSGNDMSLGGIVSEGFATPVGAPTGYNTTLGGNRFLGFVPQINVGTAHLDLAFATPIQAFGCYITGLEEDVAGSVYALFNDGTSRSFPIVGPPGSGAGVQFWGFTDPGASIVALSLEERDVSGTRDIYGIDDISIVPTPEPATLSLLALGGLLIARRRRA